MSTPIRTYMPISEQMTNTVGLVNQPWFRFFQTMAGSTDAVILANIPLLRTQVNSMLADVSSLQSRMTAAETVNTRQDDDLMMALAPLSPVRQPNEDAPLETPNNARVDQLAQRMNDIELWSLK